MVNYIVECGDLESTKGLYMYYTHVFEHVAGIDYKNYMFKFRNGFMTFTPSAKGSKCYDRILSELEFDDYIVDLLAGIKTDDDFINNMFDIAESPRLKRTVKKKLDVIVKDENTCFAMDRYGKCKALVAKNCNGCKFYKTEQQARIDEYRANMRLRKLKIVK